MVRRVGAGVSGEGACSGMTRTWIETEDGFEIGWGDRTWCLRVDDVVPGLQCKEAGLGPLLGLEGMAGAGRRASRALSGLTLAAVERRLGRVVATYAPLGWGAAWVTAAWSAWGEDGVDLEIELQARTVGRLQAIEVMLLSTLGGPPDAGSLRAVEPRDPRTAGLSYDGRETDLAGLTTGPPGETLSPWLAVARGARGQTYVELAHADDVSRRIHEGKLPFATTRYGLFGHDLEKGVVLRARLRGLWLGKGALEEVERRWMAFLAEPLPLTR